MGEDSVHEVFFRGFQAHRDDEALNELGDFCADHMRAEKFAGLGIENGFDEAVRLAKRDGFAIAHKGEAADFERVACVFGFGFG